MKKIEEFILLFCIVLFLLPSFNLLITYSQSIGKLLILIAFFITIINHFIRNKKFQVKRLTIFLSMIIVATSFSILNVINVIDFLRRYYDFIIPILLFILLKDKFRNSAEFKNKILFIIILSSILNILIEFIILYDPTFFLHSIGNFFHPTYYEYIKYNIDRGRIFFQSYNEALIPLLFFATLENRIFILIIFIIIQSILTIQGNFRTNVLMLLLSYFGVFLIYVKNKNFFRLFVACSLVSIFFTTMIFIKSNNTIVDRFLLTNSDDLQSITSRTNQIPTSLKTGLSGLFGIGLGNNTYYLNTNKFYGYQGSVRNIMITDQMPHNFFLEKLLETGIIGLLSYVLLIGYFFISDIITIKKGVNLSKIIIISFWSLFTYALFNPSYNLSFNVLFFVLRAYL